MRDVVIGMAGHIDHGKTSVIKALTGIDTDTLPEEKLRGMTIDLGFTQIKFENGTKAGLVDVPGHEKFIKNMSAGISGVDYLILVIACDDGIMPQTEEHFQIARLFGIKKGMILLTKRDLVDEDQYLKLVKEIRKYFMGTFLENSPLLPFSIDNLESHKEIKKTLQKEIENLSIESRESFFRMDIDRVFSVKGFGCVVTGTVKSGSVKLDDKLKIYPSKIDVKVKGLESHKEKKELVKAGNRCAINLLGVDSKDIKRGDIIAENLLIGDKIDCYLTLLPENIKKLKNGERIRLNIGTEEVIGKVIIYEKNFLLSGKKEFVQLQLEKDIGVNLGEKGIVRSYSPISTLGGVEVLTVSKENARRKDSEYINFLNILLTGKYQEKIEVLLKKQYTFDEISALLGEKIEVDSLLKENRIFLLDKIYIHREEIEKKLEILMEKLKEFHEKNSILRGVLKSQIKELLFKDYSFKVYNEFFNLDLVKEKIDKKEEYIFLKDFKIKLNKEEKNIKEEIFSYYKNSKFTPSSYLENIGNNVNRKKYEIIHKYMLEEGFVEYLENDKYILKGFLKESIKLISEYIEKNKGISVKECRELLNNDRDSAILILRKLDALKITKNVDGIRVLYNRREI